MRWKLIYPSWRKLEGQTPFHLPPHAPVVVAAEVPDDIELEFADDNVDTLSLGGHSETTDQPDLVALSIMLTAQLPRAFEIAEYYRGKGVPVLAGGIATMLHWEELSRHVDSVFLGEVEGRLAQVSRDLKHGAIAPVYDYLTDFPAIDSVGSARRDILNRKRYVYRGVPMVDLVHASRGCRFNCFPCCTPFLGGRQFRPRPIKKVVEEVQSIDNNRLFFVDNSFAQDAAWQEELFKALVPLKRKWVCHPIENNDHLLELAYEAGCWYVYQAIFDTSDVIRERVRNYQKHGIAVEGTIILGTDNHDEDYIRRLVDFLLEIGVDLAEFTILTPFPHSPIREQFEREGRILSNDWAEYTCDRVVFQPKLISPRKLQDLYYYAWETFYASADQNLKMAELLRKTIDREIHDGTYQPSALTSGRRHPRSAPASDQ
ncbi:MAG: cobalamin-dependent protein [Phycisphaerales bacterium]|nr:MAG: cobalamin-dependent protein [Phycisphaerales bacterium]